MERQMMEEFFESFSITIPINCYADDDWGILTTSYHIIITHGWVFAGMMIRSIVSSDIKEHISESDRDKGCN